MPPLEAWEKALVDAKFLEDKNHATAGCISCHGGVAGKGSKKDLHVGMVADPAAGDGAACSSSECHAKTVANHAKSIHGTQQGFLTSLAAREGGSVPSANMMNMHKAACAGCHTTCGQCHVSRPRAVQGGFIAGHVFKKTPNVMFNCVACHGSRIGEEFRGQHEGLDADVHYLKQMNCFDCHDSAELHGDGSTPKHRYAVPGAPTCLECHKKVATEGGNMQHTMHAEKVSCQVCHSQPYKNCYGCHVGKEKRGLKFPSRLDFRIGRNPLQSPERPWKWVVLRHVPILPDSFDEWDVQLPSFASATTWRYATPHNIQRKTPQNADCKACHEDPSLWLTADAMQALVDEGVMVPAEIKANEAVVVHKLP